MQYHISYGRKYTFTLHPQMQSDNVVVYAAKGIDFTAPQGANFRQTQEDPRVETYVAKNIRPGQTIAFTVSGEGQMPADAAGTGMQQSDPIAGSRPGGGLGVPIATPDPLTNSKGWILGGLAAILTGAGILFLRKKDRAIDAGSGTAHAVFDPPSEKVALAAPQQGSNTPLPPQAKSALLNTLKEELFAIEMEKASGAISTPEYDQIKAGLEAVLKRVLMGRTS